MTASEAQPMLVEFYGALAEGRVVGPEGIRRMVQGGHLMSAITCRPA